MTISNAYILRTAVKSKKNVGSNTFNQTSPLRLLVNMICVLCPTIICSLPLGLVCLLGVFGIHVTDGSLQWIIIICMPADVVASPIIYLIRQHKLRKKTPKGHPIKK